MTSAPQVLSKPANVVMISSDQIGATNLNIELLKPLRKGKEILKYAIQVRDVSSSNVEEDRSSIGCMYFVNREANFSNE